MLEVVGMDKNAVIVMKKKLNVTDLAGEKVMVDFETGKYFLIKGVGNDIWDLLVDGVTVDEIVNTLLSEYDVTEEVCRNEVKKFLEQMVAYRFIQMEE